MHKSHLTAAVLALGTALVAAAGTAPALAAPPTVSHEQVTDLALCGGPENPDFVLLYQADFVAKPWDPQTRGASGLAVYRSRGRSTETYTINGHALVVESHGISQVHSVTVRGDRLYISVYSTGPTTWSLDGEVLARSTGQLRIDYSANHNGTPNDRGDDFDFHFGEPYAPGAGRNLDEPVDPCVALAPFAS